MGFKGESYPLPVKKTPEDFIQRNEPCQIAKTCTDTAKAMGVADQTKGFHDQSGGGGLW
jgi:hypothetical protein